MDVFFVFKPLTVLLFWLLNWFLICTSINCSPYPL